MSKPAIFQLLGQEIPDASAVVSSITAPEFANNGNEFNKHGYRSDEFDKPADIKILSIGCSHVFGYMLPIAYRFSNVVCEEVAKYTDQIVANWNFGLPSKSNDYIARTLVQFIPILKPDIVLVAFTAIGRREYFDIEGNCVNYLPNGKGHIELIAQFKDVFQSYDRLLSPNQDLLNFYMNYQLITQVCRDTNFWFTIAAPSSHMHEILSLTDTSRYIGDFERLDFVDAYHMGPLSNHRLAKKFLRKIRNINEKIL